MFALFAGQAHLVKLRFVQAAQRESILYFHEDECQELQQPHDHAQRFRDMHREFFLDSVKGDMPVMLTQSSTRMVFLRSRQLMSGNDVYLNAPFSICACSNAIKLYNSECLVLVSRQHDEAHEVHKNWPTTG